MRIDLITAFPKILREPLDESIIKQGKRKDKVNISIHDLRDYTNDKHRTVDDYPYGGGPGMVLKIEPVVRALDIISKQIDSQDTQYIMTTPRGETFSQKRAVKMSLVEHLVIICGHYKGVDERIYNFYPVQDVSIGDFILSSGEVAALVLIDAVVRLLPGVIKDINSAWTDSFSDHLLDAPYYTRPEEFRGQNVPDVLLSGNHKEIEEWRLMKRKSITKQRRPDLYKKYNNQ
ncbi:MAG: tRNA (guanosine(37)-N1)-methyltransferase TrmD [Caldithrix sp.]|nr:tRNA (guanosine(37)-N1)-methyltransferase TrmD [Caldithrix sp.]